LTWPSRSIRADTGADAQAVAEQQAYRAFGPALSRRWTLQEGASVGGAKISLLHESRMLVYTVEVGSPTEDALHILESWMTTAVQRPPTPGDDETTRTAQAHPPSRAR
jgi:hypothetical protein